MGGDALRRIADAVLYEGYVLWPYRRSAVKNQRRWTFGGVYPEAHSAHHPDDACAMQTEVLLEGDGASCVEVRVRFLHVVRRQVARRGAGGFEPVDELEVAGERHVSWDEATEREVAVPAAALASLSTPLHVPVDVPAGATDEDLGRDAVIVRSWRALAGSVDVEARQLEHGLHRLRVRIVNTTPFAGEDRDAALRQTFCSTHTVVTAGGGKLVSQTDPPDRLRAAAEACENVGTWPVLVGEAGERHTVLSSPIILPDHPEIAPESPGDLFDASEVDQLLTLGILSMTDTEKDEMRVADPRARAILERTESLSPDELMRLHGAIRERGPAR